MTVRPALNFASDNTGPVHPQIMAAIVQANEGHVLPYGADPWTEAALAALRAAFEAPRAEMLLVPSGIAANVLGLSLLVRPWQRVFCSDTAHIERDEAGALGHATGGAEPAPVPSVHGKMTPEALEARIVAEPPERRGALSLTQVTEAGTVYSLAEIEALSEVARHHDLPVHLDGARWSNAVAALGCAPADMTWRAGVDVLSLGGTKAGLLGAEAVVFFRPGHGSEATLRRTRMGLTLSKQRFLSVQLTAWLTDDLWHEMAARANAAAAQLADGLRAYADVTLEHPAEANIVFARFPRVVHHRLQEAGVLYYPQDTFDDRVGPGPADDRLLARLVCDWSCDGARVGALLDAFDAPAVQESVAR